MLSAVLIFFCVFLVCSGLVISGLPERHVSENGILRVVGVVNPTHSPLCAGSAVVRIDPAPCPGRMS